MIKDFDEWNFEKQKLEKTLNKSLYKSGDIWWCSVGLNIGTESCGKGDLFRRPVCILKKLSADNFIGIPLSTQKKERDVVYRCRSQQKG